MKQASTGLLLWVHVGELLDVEATLARGVLAEFGELLPTMATHPAPLVEQKVRAVYRFNLAL